MTETELEKARKNKMKYNVFLAVGSFIILSTIVIFAIKPKK